MRSVRLAPVAIVILGALAACAPARPRAETANAPLVSEEDIRRNPGVPIETLIQRKVPGVTVSRVGDGIALLIRGATGYDDRDRPPLYVLNGSPFTPGPGGVLSGVDPYEIATIKVLRGGDAALYGIDGANGVIVITTKRAGAQP